MAYRSLNLGLLAVFGLLTVGLRPAQALSPMVEFQDLVAGQGEEGFEDGAFYSAQFDHPLGLAPNPDGSALYVADDGNHRIRMVLLDQKNTVETLAGTGVAGKMDGSFSTATFNHPQALAVLPDGRIAVSDAGNSLLRMIDPNSKTVSTIAGGGAAGTSEGEALKAALSPIWNLAFFATEQCLYFSQPGDGALRRLDIKKGLIETVLKDNPALPHPAALCSAGGKLFVADLNLPQVYQVQWTASAAKASTTPTPGASLAGSASLQAVGQAHHVMALAGSAKSLYAYQADPQAPLQKVLPDNGPVSFVSAWGTQLTNPDPGSILLHFKNVATGDAVGFMPDPRSEERYFFTNPSRSIVCSWRDLGQARMNSYPGEDVFNNAGIHDFEYPRAKPPGTFRILLLGRSYIYWTDDDRRFEGPGFDGEGTKLMYNLAKQMELSLNALSALEDLPCRFEVLNAGMHHDADNEVNVFSYYVAPPLARTYDVDLVVVMQDEALSMDAFMHKPLTAEGIPADKTDPEFLLLPNKEKFKSGPLHDFFELCKAKKLLGVNSPTVWTFPDMNGLVKDPDTRAAMADIMGKPLRLLEGKIHSMTTSAGRPRQLLFCYFPVTLHSPKAIRSFWKEACGKNGIPFVDLCDDFTAVGYSFYPYLPWESGHYTIDGMHLFSTIMIHELMHQGMIPGPAGVEKSPDQGR